MFKKAQRAWKSCLLSAKQASIQKKERVSNTVTTRGLLDNWNSFKKSNKKTSWSAPRARSSSKGKCFKHEFCWSVFTSTQVSVLARSASLLLNVFSFFSDNRHSSVAAFFFSFFFSSDLTQEWPWQSRNFRVAQLVCKKFSLRLCFCCKGRFYFGLESGTDWLR